MYMLWIPGGNCMAEKRTEEHLEMKKIVIKWPGTAKGIP